MRILTVCVSLLLVGCAGGNLQQTNNQMGKVANAEFAAWDRLTDSGSKHCANGKDPASLNKAQALAFTQCMDGYVEAEIAPIAMYPDLLAQFRLARLKSRKELEQDKITWKECRLQSGIDWHTYIAAIDGRVRQAQMQAYQTDVVTNQARAQQMQVLATTLQQGEAGQATPMASGCAYNPAKNAYQECLHFTAGGQCAHYGGVCTP